MIYDRIGEGERTDIERICDSVSPLVKSIFGI